MTLKERLLVSTILSYIPFEGITDKADKINFMGKVIPAEARLVV